MTNQVEWFVRKDEKIYGPFTSAQLRQLASSGKIGPDSLVHRACDNDPAVASRLAGLFTARGNELRCLEQPAAPAPRLISRGCYVRRFLDWR